MRQVATPRFSSVNAIAHALCFPPMSTPAPKEPTPFEKFKAVAAQLVSVPRAELEKRELAWKKKQAAKREPGRSS